MSSSEIPEQKTLEHSPRRRIGGLRLLCAMTWEALKDAVVTRKPPELPHTGVVFGIAHGNLLYRDENALVGIGLETVRVLTGLSDDEILQKKDRTVIVTRDVRGGIKTMRFE